MRSKVLTFLMRGHYLLSIISMMIISCDNKLAKSRVHDSFQMREVLRFDDWSKRQGGAIYDDMLVSLRATDLVGTPNGYIYDLKKGEKLCDLTFTSRIGNKKYTMPHANQVSFGMVFFDDESVFPLLYISQVNGGSGYNDLRGERGVLVYNLKQNGENSFEPELVQAIIPDLNDTALMEKLGKYTPNYIINPDKNQFIVIGYPNNSWYDLTGPQPIAVFDIPSLSQGTEIILTNEDVVDSYTLPVSKGIQQSFYCDGKVYSIGGDQGSASFRVIDLLNKRVEYYKDMTSITSGEPQFIGLWNRMLLYYEYDVTGKIYELRIPGYDFRFSYFR